MQPFSGRSAECSLLKLDITSGIKIRRKVPRNEHRLRLPFQATIAPISIIIELVTYFIRTHGPKIDQSAIITTLPTTYSRVVHRNGYIITNTYSIGFAALKISLREINSNPSVWYGWDLLIKRSTRGLATLSGNFAKWLQPVVSVSLIMCFIKMLALAFPLPLHRGARTPSLRIARWWGVSGVRAFVKGLGDFSPPDPIEKVHVYHFNGLLGNLKDAKFVKESLLGEPGAGGPPFQFHSNPRTF